jgi:hypothetical protein
MWAEAAALSDAPDVASRLGWSTTRTAQNLVASTIVSRAASLHAGRLDGLDALAERFIDAGCPHQAQRTATLAAGESRSMSG